MDQMDDWVELCIWRKEKVARELEMSVNENIICQLPDSLLHHILSFLSTKCAVSTGILSKRWRNLWMSTTNLDFTEDNYLYGRMHRRKFTSFVDQVLLYHSSNITRFHLKYIGSGISTKLTESWISAAVKRQVQELRLVLDRSLLSLPPCLCMSEMLSVLELRSLSNLELPSNICLSSLKILRLEKLHFMDDLSFGRLFSSLPRIEELEINNCDWEKLKNVVISLPTLRCFKLSVFGNYDRGQDIVVRVTAKNLVSLNCLSDLSIDLIVDNMPSLDDANIRLTRINGGSERAARYTSHLFGGLGFAKSITISEWCFWDLHDLKSINLFPMFVNLTSLNIESEARMTASAAVFISILKNAPLLESLVINLRAEEIEWFTKPYPGYIEFNLRDCSPKEDPVGFRKNKLFMESLLKVAKPHCSVSLRHQQRQHMFLATLSTEGT